ncbi:unnamed protein product [Amaranthus hypochondriacus]
MRGGRSSRGRGGRGRGEEGRDFSSITRSGTEKQAARAEPQIRSEEDDSGNDDPGMTAIENEIVALDESRTVESKEEEIRTELKSLKLQLESFQKLLTRQGQPSTEKLEQLTSNEEEEAEVEEFPPLTDKTTGTTVPSPQLSLWKDKVTTPNPPLGMPLKFVPPLMENGSQVVQIESHELVDYIKIWERAVVLYVVGGNVTIDILRGFIRKHWSFVNMPAIHNHEEGYFILRFSTEDECEAIIKGGPYFLNRAPMIVKKWTMNFDFKEEIMRVIPVWVRLPNLPLHCWGEDTLSRIVSAIGVPTLADECTAKQLKVSYARVLVEVDVTQEFTKEVRVRDNLGREFVQKVIPEWKPYYCGKCNKLGHICNENTNENGSHKSKEGGALKKDNRAWIPKDIAKFVHGAASISDLKDKLAKNDLQTHSNIEVAAAASNNTEAVPSDFRSETRSQEQQLPIVADTPPDMTPSTTTGQQQCVEEGWTPVAPSKAARKVQHKGNMYTVTHEHMESSQDDTQTVVLSEKAATSNSNRDGTPPSPSPK